MFKNGELVECVNSSGSIYLAEGKLYRVSHDSGKEICLQGIPGYYNSDAFSPYYESKMDAEIYAIKGLNHVNNGEQTGPLYKHDFSNGHQKVMHQNHVDESIGSHITYTPQTEKTYAKSNMTLPMDSKERKDYPLLNGCLRYFPAALAGVALISKKGNDKHNPGEELHHARGKSMDHGDCIVRHLIDVQDLLKSDDKYKILEEVSQLVWRTLAYSQELHEKFGAPLAPGAKK